MTDKERLEEIREKYSKANVIEHLNGIDIIASAKEDIVWLIQQSERVQKLENKLENVMDRHTYLEGDYYDLQKQNKRYREALKNIYDLAEYNEYDNTLEQIVSEIEKALEGEE